MTCEKEISLCLEKIKKDIPFLSLLSINQYIEYAKEKGLVSRYYPVVDCGFIIYHDTTIFLTSEEGGTTLSINPILA